MLRVAPSMKTSQLGRLLAATVGSLAFGMGWMGDSAAGSPRAKDLKETTPPPAAGNEGALAVAREAYIYGYPMMLIDETRQVSFKGVTNHFAYLPAPPPPSNKAVVRPNVDTLYTTAFLDLTAEPVVIHMPDMHGRYDVMEMMDANSNVFAAPGKRTTGTGAHDFVVVGPGWKQPVETLAGMTEIRSPTNAVWVLNRTQLNGEGDIKAVNAIQNEFAMAPLSEWPKGAIPALPIKTDAQPPEKPPARVEAMEAPEYFGKLALLLRDNLPPPADAGALSRFATIGLVPGRTFDPSPDLAMTLEKARGQALDAIKEKAANLGEMASGWRILVKGVGTYGTDYLQRAAVAVYGLGANLPADAVYPGTSVDAKGQALEGGRAYVLHFGKDQIPPVNAFWSVTMYDKDGYFVPNPLRRYAARDSQLKKNADGSVDIYLQAESKGGERQANWLPAPKSGPFTLLLRMYWPKESVVDGAYKPPGVEAAPSK